MQENVSPPKDMGDNDKAKFTSAVRSLIIKSISREICGEFPLNSLITEPQAMMTTIAVLFAETSDAIYHRLES